MNVLKHVCSGSWLVLRTHPLKPPKALLLPLSRSTRHTNISRHSSSSLPDKRSPRLESITAIDTSPWTKEQVSSWLSSVQPLEEDDKRIWDSLRIDGKSLPKITHELLVKSRITSGPALNIVSEVHKLLRTDPQPTTLNSLSEMILNDVEFKRHLKKDPSVPIQLATNDAKFERVGRDDAMRKAVAAFAVRLFNRTKGIGHDRQRNPLSATLTTTGGGKSFFLDQLGALDKDDLEMYKDEEEMRKIISTLHTGEEMLEDLPAILQEIHKILQNTVAVSITYNGGSNRLTEVDDHINPSLGLALRALHSYFIGPETAGGLAFSKFVVIMEERLGSLFSRLSLQRAIQCIAEHSKKGVLLLVDEIMKSEHTVHSVVKQIGVCLDELAPSQFNAVITTLNMVATKDETKSGRSIIWIPLLPAKYSDAIKLFEETIDEERRKNLSSKGQRSLAGLEQCISDCNGHFRSLESLWVLWTRIKWEEPSYSDLVQRFGRIMGTKQGKLKLPHVRAALLGKLVKYDTQVPGLPHTYGEYLEMGVFLNTIATEATPTNADSDPEGFIPRLSPVQLMTFALNNIKEPDWEEYPYAKVILSMLSLEQNFSWEQYEHFHAYWEILIRLIHCGTDEKTAKPWTIQQLYGAPKVPRILGCSKFVDNNPSFYLSKRFADICEWPTHFPQVQSSACARITQETFPKLTCETILSLTKETVPDLREVTIQELTKETIIPYLNNPGFDIVGFEKERADGVTSEPIIICLECRFSYGASSTTLSEAEVDKKRDLTVDQFRQYFTKGAKLAGLTIKQKNLFLVVCAFRKVDNTAIEDLPQNTIVLNRDMLKALYTPSLSTRPQFWFPLKQGQVTKNPANSR